MVQTKNHKNIPEWFMYLVGNLSSSFMHFLRKEDGISFIECALIASLVAVVGGIALLAFGKRL